MENEIDFGIRPSMKKGCIFLDIYAPGYQSTRKVIFSDLLEQSTDWFLFHRNEAFKYSDSKQSYKGFTLSAFYALKLYRLLRNYADS